MDLYTDRTENITFPTFTNRQFA